MISLKKICSKSSSLILKAAILAASTNLQGVAVQVGPMVQISPPPGFADPIFPANVQGVMDSDFQNPPFPNPTLAGVFGQYNSYQGGTISVNRSDDSMLITSFGLNRITDRTNVYVGFTGASVLATSTDAGETWSYGPPIDQPISLGGNISQQVQLSPFYTFHGKLYGFGSYRDMHVTPPREAIIAGTLFSTSPDHGKSWTTPALFLPTTVNNAFVGGTPFNTGASYAAIIPSPHPFDDNRLLVNLSTLVQPQFISPTTAVNFGSLNYLTSNDGAVTFSAPEQVYNLIDDPVWYEQNFDPAFAPASQLFNYLIYGGQALCPVPTIVYNDETFLLPTVRIYPKKGSGFSYNLLNPLSTTSDRGCVRSVDGGKTWQKSVNPTAQTFFSFGVNPFAPPPFPSTLPILDGITNLPTVVSRVTGRVYMAYMAGNPTAVISPGVLAPYILLNASTDAGASWSHAVKINATPSSIPALSQQAFVPSMIAMLNGYVVVAYTDCRNWVPAPANPMNMDVWMAVYKETVDPHGGSTGLGLDFVEEIRLTPTSYDARISLFTVAYQSAAQPIGLTIRNNNELLVTFSTTNQGTIPSTVGYNGMTIDRNNRLNVFLKKFQFPLVSNN